MLHKSVLHNNVGGGAPRDSVENVTFETWEISININLMSAISMAKYAIPHIRESGGGSIINVSSVTALIPKGEGSSGPYITTKSAIMGFTRAMARDHGDDQIRVNCILPGLIWTPGVARRLSDEREKRKEATPYACEDSPWDIGWTAVFWLARDLSLSLARPSLLTVASCLLPRSTKYSGLRMTGSIQR